MATGVLTLIAGVAAGGGQAHAATRGSAAAAPRAARYVAADGELNGVAATAPGNAWAVGYTGTFDRAKTLILHWNGKAWS